MGVEILVEDSVRKSNGIDEKIPFDETLKKIDYGIIDFRQWSMKWYYYNWDQNEKISYYDCELLQDDVMPDKLVSGSKQMIDVIFEKLNLKSLDNPIESRKIFLNVIQENVNQLKKIISNLRELYVNDRFDEAWLLINEYQIDKKFFDECKSKLCQKIDQLRKFYDTKEYDNAWSLIKNQNVYNQIHDNNVEKLLKIINNLESMYANNDIDSAWFLIRNPLTLEKIQNDKKFELKKIIDDLQKMYLLNDMKTAWSILKEKQDLFFNARTKEKLHTIISYLENDINNFTIDDTINKWQFYRLVTIWSYIKNENSNISLYVEAINHIQLAIFFYTVGIHGHSIYWSY